MVKIDVDEEVFEFLQKNAVPFLDNPNTVIRRLLKMGEVEESQSGVAESENIRFDSKSMGISTSDFIMIVLDKEFSEEFTVAQPYRYMFKSENYLVYFQNFNQESPTLWYRVGEKPLGILKSSTKEVFLCLTNPAERIVYQIPFKEIEKQMASSGWARDYLEINIDNLARKWKELGWNISKFLKKY